MVNGGRRRRRRVMRACEVGELGVAERYCSFQRSPRIKPTHGMLTGWNADRMESRLAERDYTPLFGFVPVPSPLQLSWIADKGRVYVNSLTHMRRLGPVCGIRSTSDQDMDRDEP